MRKKNFMITRIKNIEIIKLQIMEAFRTVVPHCRIILRRKDGSCSPRDTHMSKARDNPMYVSPRGQRGQVNL